jgi:hypothetical protein
VRLLEHPQLLCEPIVKTFLTLITQRMNLPNECFNLGLTFVALGNLFGFHCFPFFGYQQVTPQQQEKQATSNEFRERVSISASSGPARVQL